jgi:hypothetical protein
MAITTLFCGQSTTHHVPKADRIIEVLLWAIDASKRRVYIGKIKNCEVLTEAQSLRAYKDHETTQPAGKI